MLSCLECRRKKLRCDRNQPCNQCSKLNRASECAFRDRNQSPVKEHRGVVGDSQPSRGKTGPATSRFVEVGNIVTQQTLLQSNNGVEDLQYRVERVEMALGINHSTGGSCVSRDSAHVTPKTALSISGRGILIRKGATSRYHNQGQKLHLLFEVSRMSFRQVAQLNFRQFPDALRFIQVLSKEPTMATMMKQFRKSVKDKVKSFPIEKSVDFASSEHLMSTMRSCIPNQDVCESHAEAYFTFYENALRVLHRPSFRHQLENVWNLRNAPDSSFDYLVPQMLLIIALTSVSTNMLPMESAEVSPRAICKLVESWLITLSSKQRTQLPTIQTYCLLLMAQKLHVPDPDQLWNASGSLVRLAMTMGLHRDPSEHPDIPPFQAEMRRRIWFTVVELDLQISGNSGHPTAIRKENFTTHLPLEINDADIQIGMTEMQVVNTSGKRTDMSCQIAIVSCLPLRLDCLGIAANHISFNYEEASKLGSKLDEYIHNLPQHMGIDRLCESPDKIFRMSALKSHMQKTLLHLYSRFIFLESDSAKLLEIKSRCVQLSLEILRQHDLFDPAVGMSLPPEESRLYFYLSTAIWRWNFMQAAFIVCLKIKALSEGEPDVLPKPHLNEVPTPWSRTTLIKSVDDAVEALIRKHRTFGSDLRDVLSLSIVLQTLKTANSTEDQGALLYEGVNRIVRECGYQINDNLQTTAHTVPHHHLLRPCWDSNSNLG